MYTIKNNFFIVILLLLKNYTIASMDNSEYWDSFVHKKGEIIGCMRASQENRSIMLYTDKNEIKATFNGVKEDVTVYFFDKFRTLSFSDFLAIIDAAESLANNPRYYEYDAYAYKYTYNASYAGFDYSGYQQIYYSLQWQAIKERFFQAS